MICIKEMIQKKQNNLKKDFRIQFKKSAKFWILLLFFRLVCLILKIQTKMIHIFFSFFSNFDKLFLIHTNYIHYFQIQILTTNSSHHYQLKPSHFTKNYYINQKKCIGIILYRNEQNFQNIEIYQTKVYLQEIWYSVFCQKLKKMDGDQLAQKLSLEMARQVFNQYKYFNYLFQNMFEQCDQSHSTMSKDFTIQKLQAICYLISPQFQKIYLGISLNDDYLEIHKGQHSERIMLGDHLNFQILRLHTQQTRIQYSNINPGYANKNKKTLGKALGLKFQSLNEDKSVKFYFQNSDEINLWINLLQNKMNQSNFNREINIIKKIKNGVHATFYYGQRVETQERVLVKAYSKERMISENTFGNYLQQVSTMRSFVQKNWLKFCLIYQSSQAYYIVMQESFAHEMINSCSFSILRGIPQNLPSSGKLQKEFNNIVSQVIDAQRENLRENLSLGRKKSGFQKSSKNFQILNHHQPLGKLVN